MIVVDVSKEDDLFLPPEPDPFTGRYDDTSAADRIVDRVTHDRKVRRNGDPTIVIRSLNVFGRTQAEVQSALAGYWAERIGAARMARRRIWARGAMELGIGVIFLALCLAASTALASGTTTPEPLQRFFIEGLIIVGWIALWHPVDLLLFGAWDLNAELRALRSIADVPVRLEVGTPGGSVAPG